MNRLCDRLKSWSFVAARVGVAGVFIAGLSGCSDDQRDARDGLAPASATAVASAPARPETLTLAKQEIKSGKAADAQQRLQGYLKQEPKGPYHAEAEYLMGQSLTAQNDFENGKKHLEIAIDEAQDRSLKALAMLGRANCNLEMKSYHLASRQYHWLDTMYRDVKGLPQDEILFKLGLATKRAGFPETADYWFNQVIELYATGPYAEAAKKENSKYTPPPDSAAEPLTYSLEISDYTDARKAQAGADALCAKGFRDVEVIATTRNSLPTYELHVGKFFNRNDALRAKTDADLAGLPATIRPAIIEPLK